MQSATLSGHSTEPLAPSPGLWWPCWTLTRREIVRFLRQRSRIIGALGTPVIFWLIVGAGLNKSVAIGGGHADINYMEFTFPGALAAILLFTSIFSMISIIDDRRDGFMQGVLVAPVSRLAIVLGKLTGASCLAVGQAALFLMLAPTAHIHLGVENFVATVAAMVLVAIAVTGLGFWLAWLMESTQGFHAIMNVVLMPMLVLSGAFFPLSGSAGVVRWLTYANPMTYAVSLMRHAIYAGGTEVVSPVTGLGASLGLTLLFAAAMVGMSCAVASRETAKALH